MKYILTLLLLCGTAWGQSAPFAFKFTLPPQTYHADPYYQYAAAYYMGGTNADGTVKDYSANARHATNIGSVIAGVATDLFGRIVYAAQFDGQSHYWRIPGTNWMDSVVAPTVTARTYICWLEVTQHVDYAGILTFNNTGPTLLEGLSDNSLTYGLRADWNRDGPTYGVTLSYYSPTSNSWHYLALQVTKSSFPTLFVDGRIVVVNTDWKASAPLQHNYFGVGADLTLARGFKGYIALPRIYTNAIFSTTDFTNDMNWSHPLTNTLTWTGDTTTNRPTTVAVLSGSHSIPWWLPYSGDPYSNQAALYYLGSTNADGTLKDFSVNSRHATNVYGCSVVPLSTNNLGTITYGLQFTNNQYWRVPGTNWCVGPVTSIVYAGWVNVATMKPSGTYGFIFSHGVGYEYMGVLITNYQPNATWGFSTSYGYYNTSSATIVGTKTNQIATNSWHHIVCLVMTNQTGKLWLDGNPVTINSGSPYYQSWQSAQFLIGADEYNTTNRSMIGRICQPRMYTNVANWTDSDSVFDMLIFNPFTNLVWRPGL